MGFGIRVPGVRISTRGVRVGPRFASVGVSTRGRVSGSVGPRIGRVSVSSGGIRIGTGLGPLGVSAGRGGIRVTGSVGPVFGSVGRSGAVVGAGLGPIWGAKGFGGGPKSIAGIGQTSSPGRMGMAVQYQRYRDEITKSGSSRRTKDEMRVAGINAVLASFSYMSAPVQNFSVPAPLKIDPKELHNWAHERAVQHLVKSNQLSHRPRVVPIEATRASVVDDVLSELRSKGVDAPDHPAFRFGIRHERVPSQQELMRWALSERRREVSVVKQVLRRKTFLRSITELCNEAATQLPSLIELWEQETQSFQRDVDSMCEIRVTKLNNLRQQMIDENSAVQKVLDAEVEKFREQQNAALEIVHSVYSMFLSGDSIITTLVLQSLMSDNEGSAAPVGFDNGDLLVVMTAPPAEDVIWPEKITQGAQTSATKKSKADIKSDYYLYMLSHAVATAREAIVASPHIEQVRVLILDGRDEEKDFFSKRLVSVLDAPRSMLERIPMDVSSEAWIQKAIRSVNLWQQALESGDPYKVLSAAETFESSSILDIKNFLLKIVELLEPFTGRFTSFADLPNSKRPRLIDFTEAAVNTADEIEITISDDVESMKTLDVDVSMTQLPDFWVLCGLLANEWDEEDVDIAVLKETASGICEYLYSPPPWDNSKVEDSKG